ncbi:MAG TPA: hypothetical protein VFJ57_14290 [Solirubrobacterales bacterium]|nr:hypothetical protein [Solirubrobacterales bacterium]
MRSSRGRLGSVTTICAVVLMATVMTTGPAQAATNVYPAKGGTFTGGPQGWLTTDASCNVALLCTAEGGYDGADGNPPGSYALNTTIGLKVMSLFKSTITFQSPDFAVSEAGDATLHLDRQFVSGALVDLAPEVTYTVSLIDRTSGKTTEVMKETIATPSSSFIGKDAAVSVKAGDTYALSIRAETGSTVAGTGLIGGTTSLRFDNVALSVQTTGGGGGNGSGNNGGAISSQQLQSLISGNGSLIGPAVLKGNKLTVKVRCPKKVGRPCKVALQGLLKKRKPATTVRRAKIRNGKTKKMVLKVKPRALPKVKMRKKLLFKETVRVGKAHATIYKRLKLVRR